MWVWIFELKKAMNLRILMPCLPTLFEFSCPKSGFWASFWKLETIGQTVLPDRSLKIKQKLVTKSYIFIWFYAFCVVSYAMVSNMVIFLYIHTMSSIQLMKLFEVSFRGPYKWYIYSILEYHLGWINKHSRFGCGLPRNVNGDFNGFLL